MPILDLTGQPLGLIIVLFIGSGVLVWHAGLRLARYADAIAEQTGLSHAFVGALLLGGTTSLPEIATTVSAALLDNVALAVNNALGSAALQVTLLAIADASAPAVILSIELDRPVLRLEAALLVLLLTLAALGILVGEPGEWSVGLWSMALLAGAVLSFFVIHRFGAAGPTAATGSAPEMLESDEPRPRYLAAKAVLAGLVVLLAGTAVALSGDALGEKTAIGASFVGVLFVAITTSLPELSTTLEAVRLGRYEMAFSNVLGTNFFNVALLGLIDLIWLDGPALNAVGRFSAVTALLGALLTSIYLTAFVANRRGRFWRIGVDSLLVVLAYLGGLVLLFHMRGG